MQRDQWGSCISPPKIEFTFLQHEKALYAYACVCVYNVPLWENANVPLRVSTVNIMNMFDSATLNLPTALVRCPHNFHTLTNPYNGLLMLDSGYLYVRVHKCLITFKVSPHVSLLVGVKSRQKARGYGVLQ